MLLFNFFKRLHNILQVLAQSAFQFSSEYLEIEPLRGEKKKSVPKDFFWNKMLEYVGEKGSVQWLEHFAFRRVNNCHSLLLSAWEEKGPGD